MTTEELRLEIQVAVKDAIKDLSSTTDEVKRLAKETKAAVPPANELKATMARLQADLKTSGTAAGLFGDKLGGLKDRQALLRGAMVDLINKGIAPETKEIQDLKLEYDAAVIASEEMEKQNAIASGSFINLNGSIQAIAAVKVFQSLVTGVLSLGEAAIETAGKNEMLKANFETLTGSVQSATIVFGELKQFSNVTPFNLEGVAAAGQQLMAAKVPIDDLTTRLGQLGDLSLGNTQKFDSMTSSFSKMAVKGKVDLEQLNVFMEAGVPILDALAAGYGKTGEAVFDMLSKGEIKTADFIAAMQRMTSEGGDFFGGMARGAKTWVGVWSTYKDSIDGVAASYGQMLLPAAKAIATALTNLNNVISSSPLLQGVLAGALVAITVLLGIWAVKMALSTAKTWLAYAAEMALNAARSIGNPLLLAAIVAVGLATGGYVAYAAAQNKATEATAAGAVQAKLTEQAYRDMTDAMRAAAEKSGDVEVAEAAVGKLRVLRAELATLERQAASAGSSLSSSMGVLLSILSTKIDPKATGFWSFKNEAEKVAAFAKALDTISDKNAVDAIKRAKQYQDALASGSSAAITAALKTISGADPAIQAKIDKVKSQIKEIESGITITPKVAPPGPGLSDEAKKWAAAWHKSYEEYLAGTSSDPYASLEYERRTKLAEQAAVDTAGIDKKTIDEINAYYASKRKILADKLAADEHAALAKLTASKIDDMQLEHAAQLASLADLETKAIAAEGLSQEQISAIHERYAALNASIETKYAQELSDTQKKEAAEAAAFAFDLANKARAAAAVLSASTVDDLELQLDRELSLFQGTEEAKKVLALNYAKQIADAQITEDKRVFAERLANAKENGDIGVYASLAAEDAAKDTQLGKIAGLGGSAAVDPMAILIDAAIEFAMSLDSVQNLLNGITTIFKGVGEVVDPLLSQGTLDLVDSLVEVGSVLAESLAPALSIFVLSLKITTAIISIFLLPALKLIGAAFSWLNDNVIVPFGNAIISMINGIINAINWALGWLGVHIPTISYLQTTAQLAATQAEIAEKTKAVSDTMQAVQELFDEKKDDLKDAYSKNVTALQNLLELGAISANEYQARISSANAAYTSSIIALDAEAKAQLKALQDILDALNEGNNISAMALRAAGVPGYAVGAIEIPQTQTAIVHEGETIIPASFSEGLRRGDLTLSKNGSNTTIIYQSPVYVAGSVISEDGLVETLARKTTVMRKRRHLENA